MQLSAPVSPVRLECRDCNRPDYVSSKPCAEAIVAVGGKVLLVKRAIEPFLGYWDIPGGFLEDGEHPEDGARREVREEARIEIELKGLIGVYVGGYPGEESINTVTLAYAAVPRGEPKPGGETTAVGYFPADAIPENLAFDHSKRTIMDWRAGDFGQR